MMNSIFRKLLHEKVLVNYMGNFVILAKTMKELEEKTIQFLKIAEKHNLYFKRFKYNFNIEEIPILRVVVGKEQVQMEQDKIKAVKKWKMPTKIKKVNVMVCLDTNIFLFLLFIFLDFIFFFFLLTMRRYMTVVT